MLRKTADYALAFALLAWPGVPARGQDSLGTILIVRTEGDRAVVTRIRAELDATDWRVVEVGPDPELQQSALAELAALEGASAAIRVDARSAAVELWVIAPDGSGDGTVETLTVTGPQPRAGLLAVRTTEALRARGLKLQREPDGASAQPGATPAQGARPSAPIAQTQRAPAQAQPEQSTRPRTRAKPGSGPESETETETEAETETETETETDADIEYAEEREAGPTPPRPLVLPRLWIELAPAMALSPGELGPALGGWVEVRLQLMRGWSFSGVSLLPLYSDRLETSEGSARVSTVLLGAAADLLLRGSSWEIGLGAGGGGLLSFMSGSTDDPQLEGTEELVTAAAPFARASLHLELGASLGLCARVLAGAALPALSVHFEQREVASWGRPFVIVTLGLELLAIGHAPARASGR